MYILYELGVNIVRKSCRIDQPLEVEWNSRYGCGRHVVGLLDCGWLEVRRKTSPLEEGLS